MNEDLLMKARRGDKTAQFQLGCYHYYNAPVKNAGEAVKRYLKSAKRGYAPAQHNLGYCYLWGDGLKTDRKNAAKWLHKAARQSFESSIRLMETLV